MPAARPVALDGKDIRGASRRDAVRRRMTVAAVEHGSGLVLGQVRIGAKSNEIPAVRELARQLDLTGRVVTLDAMHAQRDTARCLVEDCRADYLVTAVKGNQPTLPRRPGGHRLEPGALERGGDRQGPRPA